MNRDQKYEIALRYLTGLLTDSKTAEAPEPLASDPLFLRLDGAIRSIRENALALSRGDLKREIEGGGLAIGALRALQSAMRHLVRQSREIAKAISEDGRIAWRFPIRSTRCACLGVRAERLKRSDAKYRMLFENARNTSRRIPTAAWCWPTPSLKGLRARRAHCWRRSGFRISLSSRTGRLP
jgi:hypothetical protein